MKRGGASGSGADGANDDKPKVNAFSLLMSSNQNVPPPKKRKVTSNSTSSTRNKSTTLSMTSSSTKQNDAVAFVENENGANRTASTATTKRTSSSTSTSSTSSRTTRSAHFHLHRDSNGNFECLWRLDSNDDSQQVDSLELFSMTHHVRAIDGHTDLTVYLTSNHITSAINFGAPDVRCNYPNNWGTYCHCSASLLKRFVDKETEHSFRSFW
jgi:hypothetical protein